MIDTLLVCQTKPCVATKDLGLITSNPHFVSMYMYLLPFTHITGKLFDFQYQNSVTPTIEQADCSLP